MLDPEKTIVTNIYRDEAKEQALIALLKERDNPSTSTSLASLTGEEPRRTSRGHHDFHNFTRLLRMVWQGFQMQVECLPWLWRTMKRCCMESTIRYVFFLICKDWMTCMLIKPYFSIYANMAKCITRAQIEHTSVGVTHLLRVYKATR